ncbi:hypothetical protein CK203_029121 [Vitis vinifera]|uniref:Uncharacterized protein n=1 Tax=Vitis vinifera TaxID=29760 RepID=A0A438IN12_VITVI|nr:hypothetical protein CK203_029121 [Vitis vinifera]
MKSGGSVWFGVDSKSFEISLESPKGKLSGVITVRGRSFSLGSDLVRGSFRAAGEGGGLLSKGGFEGFQQLLVGGREKLQASVT